jgi:hypothetical protein
MFDFAAFMKMLFYKRPLTVKCDFPNLFRHENKYFPIYNILQFDQWMMVGVINTADSLRSREKRVLP